MEDGEIAQLMRAALYGLLALIGGLISYLCNTKDFSFKMFIIKGLGSGFAVFLMGLLCIYFAIPSTLSFCIAGTFGYLGAEATIAVLRKFLLKKINISN